MTVLFVYLDSIDNKYDVKHFLFPYLWSQLSVCSAVLDSLLLYWTCLFTSPNNIGSECDVNDVHLILSCISAHTTTGESLRMALIHTANTYLKFKYIKFTNCPNGLNRQDFRFIRNINSLFSFAMTVLMHPRTLDNEIIIVISDLYIKYNRVISKPSCGYQYMT